MWSVAQLCRGAQALRAPLVASGRNGLTQTATRQLVTPVRASSHLGCSRNRVFSISELLKSNGIVARLCSTAPKPKQSKVVGYWLLGCSGMVFTAVVLGGVTRLTESGLSMVTWRLLGEKLPTTEAEWEAEFSKYQQFPEYKYKNQHITLSEFKWIWWMEFAHRSWGRAIGAVVFLPAAFFWARGYLDRGMKVRVGVYCALVAAQGLMGWYMVRSGLEDRFQGPADVPRVSQYRLAAHLGLAFVLYAGLLGGALRALRPFPPGGLQRIKGLKGVTALAHAVKAMAFFTALSGAFVAGLDAGLVYNSFPKMGDNWIPDDILAFAPTGRNFTENPTTVQFDHRVLGTTTLALATALFVASRRAPLSPAARRVAGAVGAMAWMQVALGIATLVHYVPTPLAASHQAGSLALLTLAVCLTHELKLLKYVKYEVVLENATECHEPLPPYAERRVFKSSFIISRFKGRTCLSGHHKVMAEVPFNNFTIATFKPDSSGLHKQQVSYNDNLNCRSWFSKLFLMTGNFRYSKQDCRLQKGNYGFKDVDLDKVFHGVPHWHPVGRFVHRTSLVYNGTTVFCFDITVLIRDIK